MSKHDIGSIDDFPEGEGVKVTVDGLPVAVFNIDGEMYAVSNSCPHKGAPFAIAGATNGPSDSGTEGGQNRIPIDRQERTIACPWHGMTFELETGRCPANRFGLRTFEVVVEGDDVQLVL